MHETELSRRTYLFGRLNNIRLEPDLLPATDRVCSYVGDCGCIAPDGRPLALAAIEAEGRRFRALTQAEVQRTVHAMLAAPGPLDAFIREAVDDESVRRARTAFAQGTGAALLLRRLHADGPMNSSVYSDQTGSRPVAACPPFACGVAELPPPHPGPLRPQGRRGGNGRRRLGSPSAFGGGGQGEVGIAFGLSRPGTVGWCFSRCPSRPRSRRRSRGRPGCCS